MTSNASTKANQGHIELRTIWHLLTDSEQLEFWKFAGGYARNMNHGTEGYRKLCAALKDAESGRPLNRPSIAIPGAVRLLSDDEVQRGIGRFKSRLLDQSNSQSFLISAFCGWIQDSRRTALNAVLDAVRCPRDERGSLKGVVPPFSTDDALRDISGLASDHNIQSLALVCGALMLSGDQWNGLAAAFEALTTYEVPRSSSITAVGSMLSQEVTVGENTIPDFSRIRPLTFEALKDLKEGLVLLGQHLNSATADVSAEKVPDLNVAIDCWTLLRKQQREAELALGLSSDRIGDLEAALARQSTMAHALSELQRCCSIVHVSDSNFAGCVVIRAKCDELKANVDSGQTFDAASSRAVEALVKLIETGDILDDEQATQLRVEVEELFGKSVATAALRGKLRFEKIMLHRGEQGAIPADPPLTVPITTLETETETLSPTPSASRFSTVLGDSGHTASAITTTEIMFPEVDEGNWAAPIPEQAVSVEAETAKETSISSAVSGFDYTAKENDADASALNAHASVEALEVNVEVASAQDYESFSNFCDSNWVNTTGSVELAPWKTKDFVPALAKRSTEAWADGQEAIAYLFARGVVASGGRDSLGVNDLASADRLLSDPASHSAGVDSQRVETLRYVISNPAEHDKPNIGLVVMLEAVRPTHPFSFTSSEIEALIERASYNDSALDDVVRYLLMSWAAQLDPLSLLRTRLLDAPEESAAVVEAALFSAQDALRTQVSTLWSAAGGKIKHTHSRSAWSKFILSEVVPLRDDLAPSDPKANKQLKWTPNQIRERIITAGRSFIRIMDAAQVKHQDRSAARLAAEQIVEAVGTVVDALQKLYAQRQRSRIPHDGVPLEAGKRLLSGSLSNTSDRLSASLFAAVLHNKPQENILRLKSGYLINHVDAIRYLDPIALSRPGVARDGLCILDFDNSSAVSAIMLQWDSQAPQDLTEDVDLLKSLRNVAADHERRDILAALSSTSALEAHERTLLHRYALELGDLAFEATRELERIWGASNELMAPTEARLKPIVEEAKQLTVVASNSMTRSLLLLEWLKQNVAKATVNRDAAAKALLELAFKGPENVALQIANYFKSGDYRAGVALFHGGTVPRTDGDRLGCRRTLWRENALKIWPEPNTKLANDLNGSTTEQKRLIELWTSGLLEPSQRDAMPKLLYAVISGEAGRTPSENQKRFPVKLADLRENKDRKTTISCEAIRNYFKGSKLNPSFLPQLALFSQIVIAPSPQQANRGVSVLDDWCKAAISEAPSSVVVFLAPGLSLARRDELCSGFRKRGIAAAIIEDVDLCRLCAASTRLDGHDFIPFLEVILEQLDLDTASPFSSLDGQHVRLETYIGRKHEAERVALGWSYTRVFSGRKLGKSALLKYVANTFDGCPLPSGDTLNVIFITIAGGESERWVVDCIVDEMAKRFGLAEKPSLKDHQPAERFSTYMKRFLQEKPRHSVLLILDEADAFVEGQLSRYDNDREGSLSFRMMKELPAQVDGNQLPRIRTIFSGYRVTNTRGGVWANAGDVLILRPLAADEAIQFLEGMLARIGVALGNHAPFVAMRCGYQPAVLIRFGESLVKRLKRSNRSADRETLTVSHEEVLATLVEQGVLDEIKTVVNNNFQGNRVGAVVFGATLLALKDLEPGMALTEGPTQVLAKLREIDSDFDWLERVDTSPLSEIERNLQDFIDRELLTVSDAPRFGVREYRLRFPHFLPVLTQQSEVALEVRQQIQAIRGGASQRRVSQCVLSESAMDTIRYWYHQDNSNDCKLIVVGGHWTGALLDSKCGVPDRLGCKHSPLSLTDRPDEVAGRIDAGKQVFGGVSAELWNVFLDRTAAKPLVLIGGFDLLRTSRRYALDGGLVPVEVVTVGRVTESTLAWWFEDARALHFKAGNSIAKISRATGLVPFLVGVFNDLLQQSPGSEVSERELEDTLVQFDSGMQAYAARLCDATWSGCLSTREIELLQMAVQINEEVPGGYDLERDFHELWTLIDVQSTKRAPFSDPGDWAALKLLTEAGFLPARADISSAHTAQSLGRVSFDRSGALVRLINFFGQRSAA